MLSLFSTILVFILSNSSVATATTPCQDLLVQHIQDKNATSFQNWNEWPSTMASRVEATVLLKVSMTDIPLVLGAFDNARRMSEITAPRDLTVAENGFVFLVVHGNSESLKRLHELLERPDIQRNLSFDLLLERFESTQLPLKIPAKFVAFRRQDPSLNEARKQIRELQSQRESFVIWDISFGHMMFAYPRIELTCALAHSPLRRALELPDARPDLDIQDWIKKETLFPLNSQVFNSGSFVILSECAFYAIENQMDEEVPGGMQARPGINEELAKSLRARIYRK